MNEKGCVLLNGTVGFQKSLRTSEIFSIFPLCSWKKTWKQAFGFLVHLTFRSIEGIHKRVWIGVFLKWIRISIIRVLEGILIKIKTSVACLAWKRIIFLCRLFRTIILLEGRIIKRITPPNTPLVIIFNWNRIVTCYQFLLVHLFGW